jgi:hypothetical protein
MRTKELLHFQNDTENKCSILRTSLLHQSIEKYSKFYFKWSGWLLLRAFARCHQFWNGYPTTKELVCSAVRDERVCNSCATCILHTISYGTTQPSIHICLLQEIQAERVHLQKQESWSALCVWCNCRLWIIILTCAMWLTEHISNLCEVCTKLWEFFYRLV